MSYQLMTMTTGTSPRDRALPKEDIMFDRDRFLATDHEARLLAEAEAHRLAALATSTRRAAAGRRLSRLIASLHDRRVSAGRRFAAEPDPSPTAAPRTA